MPLVLLPIALQDTIWPNSLFDSMDSTFWLFVRNIVFLNSIHALFSFHLIFGCQEVRRWVKSEGRTLFLTRMALVWVVAFGFLVVVGIRAIQPGPESWPYKLIVALVFFGLPFHHGISQVRGLSRLYDRGDLGRAQRRERHLFSGLIAVGLIFGSLRLSGIKLVQPIQVALLAAIIGICVGIVANAFTFPRPWNVNKLLYLPRVFAWGLYFVSPAWALVTSSCHGVEYLCVYNQMRQNSTSRVNWFSLPTVFLLAVGAWVLVLPYASLPFLSFLSPELGPKGIVIAAAAAKSITLVHFYLDARIYRFRHLNAKKHVLPLLAIYNEPKENRSRISF